MRLPGQLMVRDARYKLVRYPDRSNTSISGETRELYDMQDDPDEVQNLAEGREQRSRVSDLVKAGDAWLLSRTLCPYPVIRVEGRKSEEGLPLGDEEGGTD